jgi:lipid-A-disaccharide synthase
LGIVAGETSGDQLGAGLMRSLHHLAQKSGQTVEFVGVGGADMEAAGLKSVVPISALAVNGFVEPVRKLPELWRLLRRLQDTCLSASVDAFVGVDFNVFNLLLERRLKSAGIRTVHYVSPSVYAWRRGRARRLADSADLLLALYPFESAYYQGLPLQVVHVGHPLAQTIAADAGSDAARAAARRELGIDSGCRVIALLPGSRRSEVELMAGSFFAAAELIDKDAPTTYVLPCVRPELSPLFVRLLAEHQSLRVVRYNGNARLALTACDGALVKSGTGTLEATCIGRPMVVSYRLGPWSYRLAKRLVHTPFVALPNILGGRAVVPELLQDDATPENLAAALLAELKSVRSGGTLLAELRVLRNALAVGEGADVEAAKAVLSLLQSDRTR